MAIGLVSLDHDQSIMRRMPGEGNDIGALHI